VATPTPSPEPESQDSEPESQDPEPVDPEETEPEEESEPEEEQTETIDWSEPTSNPEGYEDYFHVIWGEESYNGHPLYILAGEDSLDMCMLYFGNGEWVEGRYVIETGFTNEYGSGECTGYYYYDADGNEIPYYEYSFEYIDSSSWPDDDDPGYPHGSDSGYTYNDIVYGTEFKGHPTFITAEEYTPVGSTNSTISYYAFYPDEWIPLTRRVSDDGTMIQYVLDSGMIYYEEPVN
jgi:hypothetical protein